MPKENYQDKTKESLNYITDVLSGDDGGVPFLKLLTLTRVMSERADSGDVDALKVLEFIYQFERLIKLAQTVK